MVIIKHSKLHGRPLAHVFSEFRPLFQTIFRYILQKCLSLESTPESLYFVKTTFQHQVWWWWGFFRVLFLTDFYLYIPRPPVVSTKVVPRKIFIHLFSAKNNKLGWVSLVVCVGFCLWCTLSATNTSSNTCKTSTITDCLVAKKRKSAGKTNIFSRGATTFAVRTRGIFFHGLSGARLITIFTSEHF